MVITALVNVLNFHHPHVQSIFNEGLWGFPEDKLGINKRKWALLEVGGEVLLYGEYKGVKGIWFLCKIIDKGLGESTSSKAVLLGNVPPELFS